MGDMPDHRTTYPQFTTLIPYHSVFVGRMPFLPHNQQRQSTEGKSTKPIIINSLYVKNLQILTGNASVNF